MNATILANYAAKYLALACGFLGNILMSGVSTPTPSDLSQSKHY